VADDRPARPKGVIAHVTSHNYDGSGFDHGHGHWLQAV
jgi:hypothetical protein